MQHEWTGEGLIFKVGRFREIDCWVRFFSPDHGLITAMAFGGSRSRRRFCGCLDALNSVLFKVRFFPAKGYHVLEEGTLLRMFARLRSDPGRSGLAANCLNFLQAVRITPEEAPSVYALLMETLEALDQADTIAPVFLQLFRARFCFDYGYSLELESCSVCGRTMPDQSGKQLTLALDRGKACCARCAPEAGHNLQIGPETRSILGRLALTRPMQWVAMPMSATTRGEIFQVVDGYVQHHLGLRWNRGRFVPT